MVTAELDWFCPSNSTSGTSTNEIPTDFIVAQMNTLTLTGAGAGGDRKQDTSDDDATPTNNLLVVAEDTNGQARVALDLTWTPANAEVGYLFQWQIEGGGWTPTSGDFSDGLKGFSKIRQWKIR